TPPDQPERFRPPGSGGSCSCTELSAFHRARMRSAARGAPRRETDSAGPRLKSRIPRVTATDRRETESGIDLKPVYAAEDVPALALEPPGEFPFTRGPYETMYRGRPWTIRQYAGFGSAEETNERFRYLLERGQTGLSTAFDLPTQLGYDSD